VELGNQWRGIQRAELGKATATMRGELSGEEVSGKEQGGPHFKLGECVGERALPVVV